MPTWRRFRSPGPSAVGRRPRARPPDDDEVRLAHVALRGADVVDGVVAPGEAAGRLAEVDGRVDEPARAPARQVVAARPAVGAGAARHVAARGVRGEVRVAVVRHEVADDDGAAAPGPQAPVGLPRRRPPVVALRVRLAHVAVAVAVVVAPADFDERVPVELAELRRREAAPQVERVLVLRDDVGDGAAGDEGRDGPVRERRRRAGQPPVHRRVPGRRRGALRRAGLAAREALGDGLGPDAVGPAVVADLRVRRDAGARDEDDVRRGLDKSSQRVELGLEALAPLRRARHGGGFASGSTRRAALRQGEDRIGGLRLSHQPSLCHKSSRKSLVHCSCC